MCIRDSIDFAYEIERTQVVGDTTYMTKEERLKGLGKAEAARLVSCREEDPLVSVDDLWRRAGIPAAALVELAEADARVLPSADVVVANITRLHVAALAGNLAADPPNSEIPATVLGELRMLENDFELALSQDCDAARCFSKGCTYVSHSVADRPRAASMPGLVLSHRAHHSSSAAGVSPA